MSDASAVLQAAINEVGYWLHWEHRLPESLQVQFGGVGLITQALRPGEAPAGQIALRFLRVSSLSFLWHHSAPDDLLPDWPERLRHDAFGPCDLTPGTLTLCEPAAVLAVLQQARRIMSASGTDPRFDGLAQSPVRMAFFAGAVGMVVGAEEMQVYSPAGPVALADVPEMRERWREHRRVYWEHKAMGTAQAVDYTCEAAGPPVNAPAPSGNSQS